MSTASGVNLGELLAKPSDVRTYKHPPWHMHTVKDHIMQSTCKCAASQTSCEVCTFESSYAVLPEMVFAKNRLTVQHSSGRCITFDCRGALDMVDFTKSDASIKVSASAEWLASRQQLTEGMPKAQDFDWTFGTKYMGDVTGFEISPATQGERIDLNKLREREPILFYEELPLFEDELADHGCAQMSVRIRVMPSGYFILLRYYLRVDGVLVRLYDTRLYWSQGAAHIIREWSAREVKWHQLSENMRHEVGVRQWSEEGVCAGHASRSVLAVAAAGRRKS